MFAPCPHALGEQKSSACASRGYGSGPVSWRGRRSQLHAVLDSAGCELLGSEPIEV